MSASSILFQFGATHHQTPLELRERLTLPPARLAVFAPRLSELSGLHEYAVLSTCNRTEVYGVASSPEDVARLQEHFCAFLEFPEPTFAAVRQEHWGAEVTSHLIRVAAGLDSQLLGETEIFGQVKVAYADACRHASVGPILNRLFQKSFQAAKYVRTHTAITEGQISVANVAVDLAENIFGAIKSTRVLLLGAGEIGEKTAKAFRSRGAGALTIASRREERAAVLAAELAADALPLEEALDQLARFDIVACATAAPGTLITAPMVQSVMRQRPTQPLFFIDLALPRDVGGEVAELENVFVYNLDDLARIAAENRAAREAEVSRAQQIVEEKTTNIWRNLRVTGRPTEIDLP